MAKKTDDPRMEARNEQARACHRRATTAPVDVKRGGFVLLGPPSGKVR